MVVINLPANLNAIVASTIEKKELDSERGISDKEKNMEDSKKESTVKTDEEVVTTELNISYVDGTTTQL